MTSNLTDMGIIFEREKGLIPRVKQIESDDSFNPILPQEEAGIVISSVIFLLFMGLFIQRRLWIVLKKSIESRQGGSGTENVAVSEQLLQLHVLLLAQ